MARDAHTAHYDSAYRRARAIWRRRKWLIMLAFLVPFSIVISLVVAMPNLYRAEATVLVRQTPEALGPSASGRLESRLEAINEEVLSRARLQDLITRFDLYPKLRQHASPQAVIDRMRRDIRFKRKNVELPWGGGATVAFTLSYQGWEPRTAAQVANALASIYIEENEKIRRREADDMQTQAPRGVDGQAPDNLAALKRELAELRARFNDRYPDVLRLKAEIAALERERQGRGWIPAATPHSGARAPGLGGDQFRIIDPAIPPAVPSAPNRLRLILMGLIFSFGMAGVAGLLAEQLDTSFHRLDELWAFTNMPILAGIPRIVTRADAWRRRLRFGLAGILAVSGLAVLIRVSYFLGHASEQLVWLMAQRGT